MCTPETNGYTAAVRAVELIRLLSATRSSAESFGLRIVWAELPPPNTGAFDGTEIILHHDNDAEIALFVLAHLFGHTVQWSQDPFCRELDRLARPGAPPDVIELARVYEQQASRLGLALLHRAGITSHDQWLSDAFASDWQYLSTNYASGHLIDRAQCRAHGPLLAPEPIPPFSLTRFAPRYAF